MTSLNSDSIQKLMAFQSEPIKGKNHHHFGTNPIKGNDYHHFGAASSASPASVSASPATASASQDDSPYVNSPSDSFPYQPLFSESASPSAFPQ